MSIEPCAWYIAGGQAAASGSRSRWRIRRVDLEDRMARQMESARDREEEREQ